MTVVVARARRGSPGFGVSGTAPRTPASSRAATDGGYEVKGKVVAMKDKIFPNTVRMPQVLEMTRGVYDLYGARDALKTHVFDGDHHFPDAARNESYQMLEKVL